MLIVLCCVFDLFVCLFVVVSDAYCLVLCF